VNIDADVGVFMLGNTYDKNLKIKPSLDIAYTTRGIGNIELYRLYEYNYNQLKPSTIKRE